MHSTTREGGRGSSMLKGQRMVLGETETEVGPKTGGEPCWRGGGAVAGWEGGGGGELGWGVGGGGGGWLGGCGRVGGPRRGAWGRVGHDLLGLVRACEIRK